MSRPAPPPRVPLMPLAGLAITLIAGLAAIGLSIGAARSNRWVTHAVQTQVLIVRVGERLAAFESACRGYFVMAQPEQRPEMARTRRALLDDLAGLRRDIADNPVQVANLRTLRELIGRRVAFLDNAARTRLVPTQWARVLAGGASVSQPLRDSVQSELGRMFDQEQRLLTLRQRHAQGLVFGLAAGLAIAVLLVVVVAYLTVSEARRRFAELERANEATRAQTAAREEAEKQIAQMQKIETIGQLTGGIAHDFNNMLAVIIGSLDLAQRVAASEPARVADYIDTARGGAERAAELVARLLAFARRQPLTPATIDINQLVTGMSQLLRRTLGEEVVIETHLAPGGPHGFADRGQVENAILNLAVNGRDALEGRKGTITIVTDVVHFAPGESEAAPGRYVMIAVADTGVGMNADTIQRAIEPFFTTKEVGRGTGLGLSQVFGFAKQSGGHVAIESRLGEGTVVRLYLPRREPGIALSSTPPRRAVRSRGKGEPVLLVEDEPLVRAFSAEALRDLGYNVQIAENGIEALRLIETDAPIALLFTDVVMPGMGGEELAQRARRLRPDLKLLYTSGYRAGRDHAPLVEGAALLPKPFTVAQLAMHVREAIDD